MTLYEMVVESASRPLGERGFHNNETIRSKELIKASKRDEVNIQKNNETSDKVKNK